MSSIQCNNRLHNIIIYNIYLNILIHCYSSLASKYCCLYLNLNGRPIVFDINGVELIHYDAGLNHCL